MKNTNVQEIDGHSCTSPIRSVLRIEYQALVQVTICRLAKGFGDSDFIDNVGKGIDYSKVCFLYVYAL